MARTAAKVLSPPEVLERPVRFGLKRFCGTKTINDRTGVAANVTVNKLVNAFSNGRDIIGARPSVSDVS